MKRIISLVFMCFILVLAACGDGGGGITDSNSGGTTGSVGDISFFNPLECHTITIQITSAEWSNLSNDLYKTKYDGMSSRGARFSTEIARHAHLLVDGVQIKDVGVRVRGNTSRFFPRDADGFHWVHWKVSFSQDFSESEDVYGSDPVPTIIKANKIHFGTRGFVLKHHSDDASGVREALGYDIATRFGLMVPKFTFAKVVVSVDGIEYNYGLYQVYEPIDKQFIRTRFNGSSSYLFKCLWNDGGPATLQADSDYNKDVDIGMEIKDPATVAQAATWDPEPVYQPASIPTTRPYTPCYDLKAKTTEFSTAAGMLDVLIQGITSKTGSDFNTWIDSVFDVNSFLKSCAINAMIGQWDDFCRQANNYYLLWNPTTSKWIFVPYDMDHSFKDESSRGQWSVSIIDWVRLAKVVYAGNVDVLLAQKIMANPTWAAAYEQHVRDLTDPAGTLFTPVAVQNRANAMQSVINSAGIGTPVFSDSISLQIGGAAVSDIVDYVTARQLQAISEVGTNGGGGGFAKNYNAVYLRGQFNSWGSTSMSLVSDYTWQSTVSMNNLQEFKFADTTNWSGNNWGVNGQTFGQTSGTCVTSGAGNITNHQSNGTVTVTFNDSNFSWSIVQ